MTGSRLLVEQTQQLRVSQVIYGGMGGHGSVSLSLVSGLKHAWLNQVIATGVEQPLPDYGHRAQRDNAAFVYVPKRRGLDLRMLRGVYEALSAHAPTLIIVHCAAALLPALAFARRHGSIVIQVEHQAPQNRTRANDLWLAVGSVTADALVTISDDAARFVDRATRRLPSRAMRRTIWNGVDTHLFRPRDIRQCSSLSNSITMAARFNEQRSQLVLVEAFRRVRSQLPNADVRLNLLGDGPTWRLVHAAVSDYGLTDVVHMPGAVSETDVLSVLQTTSVYVQASRFETMSTSVLQAMACGLALVLTDIPGNRSILDAHHPAAKFVAVDDIEAMAEAVAAFVGDHSLRQRAGEAARKLAQEQYSATHMCDAYVRLVNDLLYGPKCGGGF